jgi:hypothetical protein
MLNGMGRDRGAASALEQAILPQTVPADRRTWALAWCNLVLDCGHALGALAATGPTILANTVGLTPDVAHRATFALCAVAMLSCLVSYMALMPRIEISTRTGSFQMASRIGASSRRMITRLALLFGLDSIGWRLPEFGPGRVLVLPSLRYVGSRPGDPVLRRSIVECATFVFGECER